MASTLFKPAVEITGDDITIRHPNGRRERYNRDELTTAYLLLLDGERDHGTVVSVLVRDHGIESLTATRLVLAATHLIAHNIEP